MSINRTNSEINSFLSFHHTPILCIKVHSLQKGFWPLGIEEVEEHIGTKDHKMYEMCSHDRHYRMCDVKQFTGQAKREKETATVKFYKVWLVDGSF